MAKDFKPSSRNREAYETITDAAATVPPQAVELEEAVLGALMLERDSIITVQEFITPDAFYTEEHRLIYRAIEELSAELKPIDLFTVTEKLKTKKQLTKVGGATYLAQLTRKVGSAANIEFHAKIVAQKYVQRELIRSATEIQRRSYDEETDVTELIGFAESEIFKVAEGHVKRSVQNAEDVLKRTIRQIEEASKSAGAFNGVPSGFMSLDRITLGWQLSDLIIVAARPSMGKTAFVLSMARNMAPFIEINTRKREKTSLVVITVMNSCLTNPFINSNGTLNTQKNNKQKHGFGIKSIRKIVDKYQGNMQMYYNVENLSFHTVITLKQS